MSEPTVPADGAPVCSWATTASGDRAFRVSHPQRLNLTPRQRDVIRASAQVSFEAFVAGMLAGGYGASRATVSA
ncbi:MAG TPA: hypothetical protein VEY96_06925 [Actinomycetes bacterium]|nr:hypothetical protein [Actinomycetes bacterium]